MGLRSHRQRVYFNWWRGYSDGGVQSSRAIAIASDSGLLATIRRTRLIVWPSLLRPKGLYVSMPLDEEIVFGLS